MTGHVSLVGARAPVAPITFGGSRRLQAAGTVFDHRLAELAVLDHAPITAYLASRMISSPRHRHVRRRSLGAQYHD